MKNTFLKKAGAVALAAVMAVTFAPVASLNVFAANTGIQTLDNVANTITTTAIIEDNGSYVVSAGGIGAGKTVTVSPSATDVKIDVRGEDHIKIIIEGNKTANVTVASSTYHTDGNAKLPHIPEVTVQGVTSASSLAFEGNLVVSGDAIVVQDYLGTNPAVDEDAAKPYRVTIGDVAIGTAAATGTNDLYAVNGAVNVKGLKKGRQAILSSTANVGTTLDATAADDTSLTKVVTKYDYRFYSRSLSSYGTSSYTDVRFAAGSGYWKNALDGQTLPDKKYEGRAISGASINTKYLSSNASKNGLDIVKITYDRAITLTQADKDKWVKSSIKLPYTDGQGEKEYKRGTTSFHDAGITYFTTDPTAYVSDETGVAVIDGSKYVISAPDEKTDALDNDGVGDELYNVSSFAGKSLAVLRGTSRDRTAVNAWNLLQTKEGVKVTAPTSSSIALGHTTTIGTKSNDTSNKGIVFGANHVEGAAQVVFGSAEDADDNTTVTTALEVPQVADGVYAIVNNGYTDTKVTLGTGVTYFYHQKAAQISSEHCDYVFGSVKDATNALNAVLIGKNLNTTNYFTQAKPGENVFVAKDIKTTVAGVKAKVNVLGEISADGAKQADGSYTWIINQGYGSDAVPAYRMYRKTGEHVYTISAEERDMLVNAGWINEGVAFKVNSVVSKKGTPIYRVYNKNNGGMHFYTASAAERDMLLNNGWTEGAIVFYGADKATGAPVYRTYNTGSNNGEHNYTTNIAESDMNVKAGWRAEGVAFYVFK